MEIIHFFWTRDTKERSYFHPPPCPAHKRTEIYFFLIQNWFVTCGLTEVFYCQYSKQRQEAANWEKAWRFCLNLKENQFNTGSGSREKESGESVHPDLDRASLPGGTDPLATTTPGLREQAWKPQIAMSVASSQPLSLCLLVRMGAFWQLYFISKWCSTKLNITYTHFSFLFFIYFGYTTWHIGS